MRAIRLLVCALALLAFLSVHEAQAISAGFVAKLGNGEVVEK